MLTLKLILYIGALLCLIASTFNMPSRVNLQSLGLALALLAFVFV